MGDYSDWKILGVVGNPVSHSLSPIFQNYLIKKYKLGWSYLPFCADISRFNFFMEGMRSIANVVGLNITLPFKEMVIKHCDELSYEAEKTGAVNTIYLKSGKLFGYNTDVDGIISSIKYKLNLETLKNKTVMLVGAGGAAKAAIYALYKLKAKDIIIINRSIERAEILKEHAENNFGLNVVLKNITSLNQTIQKVQPHLLINATSIGLKGDSFDIDIQKLWKECKIFDMVYSKTGTKLVSTAIQSGLEAIDGIYMLVYQGIKSFSIWSGIENIDDLTVISYLKKKVRYGKNLNHR